MRAFITFLALIGVLLLVSYFLGEQVGDDVLRDLFKDVTYVGKYVFIFSVVTYLILKLHRAILIIFDIQELLRKNFEDINEKINNIRADLKKLQKW